MLEHFRAGWAKVMNPIADALLRAHVTPDVVTWIGTIGAVLMALICFPQGWLWQGPWLVTLFIFSDSLDGNMARKLGRHSQCCLLYTSPSPRDKRQSRMPSSA